MRILIGCETSNTISREFRKLGHTVISCDLLPNDEDQTNHFQGDLFDIINTGFDMGIFHPPCPFLTVSANKWYADQPARKSGALVGEERMRARIKAIEFFINIYYCNIPKIAIENPIGVMSSVFRKPDQIIQPWMFGHGETKATCLWLRNLPPLQWNESNNLFGSKTAVEGRQQKIFKMPPSPDRWKIRSKTFTGIAEAMATQWNF